MPGSSNLDSFCNGRQIDVYVDKVCTHIQEMRINIFCTHIYIYVHVCVCVCARANYLWQKLWLIGLFCFMAFQPLWIIILPLAMGKIVGQTGFFSLGEGTSLGEGKF